MTKHRTRDSARHAAPPAASNDAAEAAPQSVEDLRNALALKLEMFMADWSRCPRRICRRRRTCQPNPSGCASPRRHKRPPLTKEQMARRLAWLSRLLKERRTADG